MVKADNWQEKVEKELETAKEKGQVTENIIDLVSELRIHQAELEMQNEELKQSQEELSKLYNQYHELYNDVPVGYFTLDKYGIIKNVNVKGVKLLQLDKKDIIGRGFSKFILKDNENKYYHSLASSINTKENQELELQLKRNKNLFYAHMEIMPLYNRDDEKYRIIITDITEHKQAEDVIKESEEKYSTLFDNTSDGVWIHDLNGKIIEVNDAYCKMSGYSWNELIHMPVSKLEAIETPEEIANHIKKVIEKGGHDRFESRHRRKDGSIFDADITALYFEKNEGRIAIFVRDITVRKQMEEKLRQTRDNLEEEVEERTGKLKEAYKSLKESEEALRLSNIYNRSLIEASLDPLVTIGPDGKITDVNTATELITGYSRDELIRTDFSDYFTEPEKAKYGYQRVFMESEVRDYPLEIQHKNGQITPVLYNASVYENEDSEVIGVFAAARDITQIKQTGKELKETIEELKRSNYELQQFAYVSSHDLQEPLRTIASFTQLLERRYKGRLDEDADDYINFVVDAAIRMKEMIQGLLEYSRVGTKGIEFKPVDFNEVLGTVSANLYAAIKENDAEITHDKLPQVFADRDQLIQLFQNLIGNAIKFRKYEEPSKIHISCRKDEKRNEYVFSVADNGIGLEPQYRNRIFKVFKRLHTIDEYNGTGIGLAICKKIVEFHGGHIWVESSFGEGSTFYFTIPAKCENEN